MSSGETFKEIIEIGFNLNKLQADTRAAASIFSNSILTMSNTANAAIENSLDAAIQVQRIKAKYIKANLAEEIAASRLILQQKRLQLQIQLTDERKAAAERRTLQRQEVQAERKKAAEIKAIGKQMGAAFREFAAAEKTAAKQAESDAKQKRADIQRTIAAINAETDAVLRQRIAYNNVRQAARSASPRFMPVPRAPTIGQRLSGATLGQGLRVGAAASGAMGSWGGAAALYGIERMATVTGHASKTLGSMASSLSMVGVAAGISAAAIAAVGGSAVYLMMKGNDLNVTLADMSTLMNTGGRDAYTFGAAIDKLKAQAASLAIKFGVDVVDVVKGFKSALSAGIAEEDVAAFVEGSTILSKALSINMEQATDTLASFKDAFKLTSEEVKDVADQLFTVIDISKIKAPTELMNNLGRLMPIAKAAGVTKEEMLAMVTTLSRQGMTAANAITATKQAIVDLVHPSKKAREEFERLGLAYGNAATEGGMIFENLKQIVAATEGGKLDNVTKLFGDIRGATGVTGLAQAMDLLASSFKEISEAGGKDTALDAATKQLNTFSANMGRITNMISVTAQAIGADLLDAANQVFFGGAPLSDASLENVRKAIEDIGKVVKNAIITFMALGKAAYHAFMAIDAFTHVDYFEGKRQIEEMHKTWEDYSDAIERSNNNTELRKNLDKDADAAQKVGDKLAYATQQLEIWHTTGKRPDMSRQGMERSAFDEAMSSASFGSDLALPEGVEPSKSAKALLGLNAEEIAKIEASLNSLIPKVNELRFSFEYFQGSAPKGKNGIVDFMGTNTFLDSLDPALREATIANLKLRTLYKDTRQGLIDAVTMEPSFKDRAAAALKPVSALYDGLSSAWDSIKKPQWQVAAEKEKKDAEEKAAKERVDVTNSIYDTAKRIYEQDVKAFERAEKKKQSILDKTASKLEEIANAGQSATNTLMDKLFEVQNAGLSDRRVGANARKQRANVKNQIGTYADKGGTDFGVVNENLGRYLELFDTEFASAKNKKSGKWASELVDMVNYISSITTDFSEAVQAEGNRDAAKISAAKPDMNSAALRAVNKVGEDKRVDRILEERLVKISIEGDIIDPAGKLKFAREIARIIKDQSGKDTSDDMVAPRGYNDNE